MNERVNEKIVRTAYEKFEDKDLPSLLRLLADDIDWSTPHVENAPFAGSRLGLDEVREFFELLDDNEDFAYFEPGEFICADNKVVVLGRSKATVKSTGRSYETDWVHVFTVQDEKITHFKEYFDNAAANRAFAKGAAA